MPDSTRFVTLPINDARAAVKIIESLRIDSTMLARDKRTLTDRITARDNVIAQMNERIKTYKVLSANYDKQIVNLNKQVELSIGLNNTLGKKLKWANTKTVIIGIAGIIVSGLTLYLTK